MQQTEHVPASPPAVADALDLGRFALDRLPPRAKCGIAAVVLTQRHAEIFNLYKRLQEMQFKSGLGERRPSLISC